MVETSSSGTYFLRKNMGASAVGGGVLRMGIAGLQDVDILARCNGTHRTQHPNVVFCQGTGFPAGG